MINLSKEQIEAIAGRLDVVVGNYFHDAIIAEVDAEIDDADVYEIKKVLAEGYLAEYKRNN
jgi:hypothetical protein|tara:strand:+ start:201 stop:383 length:183 start_codon:yes stop_codon:yes gene_type:complete